MMGVFAVPTESMEGTGAIDPRFDSAHWGDERGTEACASRCLACGLGRRNAGRSCYNASGVGTDRCSSKERALYNKCRTLFLPVSSVELPQKTGI